MTASAANQKQRFIFLDAMRCLAALAVAELHAAKPFDMPFYLWLKGAPMVDFFFCLSGFVLSYAHIHQFERGGLTFTRFMTLRYIRIFPMVIIGTLIGTIAVLTAEPDLAPPLSLVPIATILSFLCIPVVQGFSTFWINGVFWSLLAELVANAAFALFILKISNKLLACIVIISGTIFGITTYMGFSHWFADISDVLPTVNRACASFFAGVLVFRIWSQRASYSSFPWWPLVLILFLVMIMPVKNFPAIKSVVMALLVIIIFPLIIFFGSRVKPPFPKLMEALGRASFPLYAIHAPIFAIGGYWSKNLPLIARVPIMFGLIITVLITSLFLADYYEAPLRRKLRRWLIR